MKKLRLFLGCCAVLCCAAIQASVQIGDLYYDLDSSTKTATVVSPVTKSLTSVVIPDTITSDGVKYTVTNIKYYQYTNYTIFAGCNKLVSVSIPSSITKIGRYTFAGCTSLTSVNIPSSVTSIGEDAFYGCSNLKTISVDIQNSHFSSENGILYNKEKTVILSYPSAAGDIKLISSITSISDYAFHGCSNLTSINIPTGVTSIGNGTFNGCTNLTSVNIPAGVTSIGNSTFNGCTNLTSVNIPTGVTSIGDYTFYGCANLTSVNIPSSVTSIGSWAFEDCSNLTSINIPSNVTNIGGCAFNGCTNLTSINIPSSVTSIGNNVFEGCSFLVSVTIPSNKVNSFTTIFSGCYNNIDSVTVTSTSGAINMANSFTNSTNLRSVTLSSDIISIGTSAFSGCTSLQSVNIPSSVTSIGSNAFSNCSNLKSIIIPTGVTSIGTRAFSGCTGLSSITLPSNLTDLKAYAFDGCTNLKKVSCLGPVPTTGSNIFNGNDLSKDLLCVDSTYLEAYRDSTTWKDFGVIKTLTSTDYSPYNTLAINDTIAYLGTQMKLPVLMTNADLITAFQCDIYLPAGVTIAKQDGDYLIDLGERTTLKKHTLSSALQSDGAIRVVVYSSTSTAFTGTSGAALYLTLDIADTVAAGDYQIQIKNMTLSTVDAKAYSPASVSSKLTLKDYRLGDVDNNGIVNINDAVAIVNKLLGKSSTSFLAKAADVDKDGNITINDVVMLINKYILNLSTSSAKARYAGTAAHNMATLDAEPININAGEEHTMDIALNNPSDAITAFQFDVNLPKGFSIVKDADGSYSQLAEERNMSATHQLGSNMLQNGDLRVACFSANNAVIEGQNGAVAAIRIKADANVPNGTYYLTLHNAVLAHPDGMNSIAPAEQRIAINVGTTGIENAENSGLQITAGKGIITLQTSAMQAVQIAAVNGMRIAAFTLQAGESRTLKVAAGLYIVNGKKVVVK